VENIRIFIMKTNQPQSKNATVQRDSTAQEVLSDISNTTKEAFRRGKADAYAAVEKTLPTVKRSIAKGVYMSCYYLAFGAVYSAKLAMELVPEDSVIRDGFRHGAQAAEEAYEQRSIEQNTAIERTPGNTAPSI
jgi:hypothetical protein